MEKQAFAGRARLFRVASDEEIKSGRVADVYFQRTMDILVAKGMDKYDALRAAHLAHRHLPR